VRPSGGFISEGALNSERLRSTSPWRSGRLLGTETLGTKTGVVTFNLPPERHEWVGRDSRSLDRHRSADTAAKIHAGSASASTTLSYAECRITFFAWRRRFGFAGFRFVGPNTRYPRSRRSSASVGSASAASS
jgi:hypothetical protein